MDSVLATLEAFHAQTEAVFDRIDAACDEADAQLGALEERLTRAVRRVEASCGSTRPLVVCSARTFGGQPAASVQGRERVFGEGVLVDLVAAAPLPGGAAAGGAPPAVKAAVDDLAGVVQCVASAPRRAAPARVRGCAGDRLLAPGGRLASMPELLLFNSHEQPYRARRGADNLAGPCEEERPAPAPAGAAGRRGSEGAALQLEEDEPDPLLEDLRFRPGRASEVCFDLPDSLPDLGGPVANILWRQQDQAVAETERPAWDAPGEILRQINSSSSRQAPPQAASQPSPTPSGPSASPSASARAGPPAESSRAGADLGLSQPRASIADAPALFQPPASAPASSKSPGGGKGSPPPPKPRPPPPPPAAAKGKAAADRAPEAAATAKGAPPPPPPPAKGKGKGKGKGPGKGPGPKPPPPPKPKATDAAPPPPKPPAAGGGGKAEMFAAICKGAALRKVGAPKERSGATVGRVMG